ncbi:MAG TPA: thioredoxin [Solirubrobacterales bacterium]|nr:thioredoxin [Solirubrobacterales bacterium]
MIEPIKLSRGNFEQEVLRSDVAVLVDYWAAWCGPCRAIAPTIDAIAREHEGSLKVGKVDVDSEPELAATAGAMSIPYVVLYRDGEAVAHAIGARPKEQLERALGLEARLDLAA